MSLYLWLKAVHVLAVAIWLGAAVTVSGVAGLMTRTSDLHRMGALASVCDFASTRLIAPAGGITFLFGIVAVFVGHFGMSLWVWWGVVGALLVLSVGGAILGRGFRRLARLLEAPAGREAEIGALVGRLRAVGVGALVVLVSTVLVMVLKPTL